MPFTLGSKLVTAMPLADYLRLASRYFKVIEIPTDPVFFSAYFSLTNDQKKVLIAYSKEYNFRYSLHAPFCSSQLGSTDQERRNLAIKIVESILHTASEMQIKLVTCHPSEVDPDKPNYEEICQYEAESLAILLSQAKQLGITILLENMPRYSNHHPKVQDGTRLQELLWLFPEPEFGLTIDIGHALQAGIPLDSLLKLERIRNFHLHDNDRLVDSHQPIRKQLTWWRRLVARLEKEHPTANTILELNRWQDQEDSFLNLQKPTQRKKFENQNLGTTS